MTVMVSSPRLRINRRCWSLDGTAYTGHLPTGIAGSVVLLEISIGTATPVDTEAKLARLLQVTASVWIALGKSGTFWLMTYSRWPESDGDPAIKTGMVEVTVDAGATGTATGIA